MGWRKVHLDQGDFSFTLGRGCARERRPDMDTHHGGFSRVIVTPGPVPPGAATAADLMAVALYTGIILGAVERDDGTVEVSGAGPLVLLGDPDSKGKDPITNSGGVAISARPFHNGTATSWVNAALDRANGLTKGTIPSAAAPTETAEVPEGATGLEILRTACRGTFSTGREFEVDDQLRLHANTKTNLFRSGHAVIGPGLDGPDGTRWGIPATIDVDGDLEDYSTDVTVNNGPAIQGTATAASVPYFDPAGDPIEQHRTIQSQKPPTNLGADRVAQSQLNRFSAPAYRIPIKTTSPLVGQHLRPGDWPLLYDPGKGLFDLDNEIIFGGRPIAPVAGLRVSAMRHALDRGRGLYMVTHDGTDETIIDWSYDYVPEAPGCDIEVGQITRTLGYEPLSVVA